MHSASLSVINGQIFRLLLKISVEEKKKNETIEIFSGLAISLSFSINRKNRQLKIDIIRRI